MSWLKTLWSWFTTPSEDVCCEEPHEIIPVEVEEEQLTAGEIFQDICRAAGIQEEDTERLNAVALLKNGTPELDEESIKDSIQAFATEHGIVFGRVLGKLIHENHKITTQATDQRAG